jgi:hypothetical protein
MLTYEQKALNLFNAALVTPTYYVLFTSATIVTSAVLFQGFKGTPLQIVTVIMGFLQICSGVVLLQLSKSAKDVPDAAVFKGDLDQVRQVAEVEEPEYEPRADALRGGSAILRSLSKARSEKEAMEVRKIKEEHMQPIGEGETVEFDGIRRRRTVIDPNRPLTRSGTIMQSKMSHPPLGMSHFPVDESDDDNDSFHPGFFQRLRSRGKSTSSRGSGHVVSTSSSHGMKNLPPIPTDGASDVSDKDSAYKTIMTQDTSYRSNDPHIQFADLPHPVIPQPRTASPDSLAPPRHPAQIAKRQFSFQNVFGRNRGDSTGESSGSRRPTSRHSRKDSQGKTVATEEERLGLVKGDSSNLLPIASHISEEPNQLTYSDESDWAMPRSQSPGYSPIREQRPPRRVDTEEYSPVDDKDIEKERPRSNAFL